MIEIKRSKHYTANEGATDAHRDGHNPCAVCGRAIAQPWPLAVHVHDGGHRVVQEAEAAGLSEGADLGWWPIGKDCAARHPAMTSYVYEWRLGEPVPAFPAAHDAEAARIARGEGLRPMFPAKGDR